MPLTENTEALWGSLFPFPKSDGHKYDRGQALIYGGALMTGAARLAARAAERIGAGLVTIGAPLASFQIYAEALESVMVRHADTKNAWLLLISDPKRNACLIGPGLDVSIYDADLVLATLSVKKPTVLDAGALINFSDKAEILFSALDGLSVLTPHEGEFARLFGNYIDLKDDKVSRAQKAATLTKAVILLKGKETIIASPDGRTVLNQNAPPSLATAGAGDVLSGMILGLLTQGMPAFEAAASAAFLHGKIATDFGLGLIAEDLISGIPKVLTGLSQTLKKV